MAPETSMKKCAFEVKEVALYTLKKAWLF